MRACLGSLQQYSQYLVPGMDLYQDEIAGPVMRARTSVGAGRWRGDRGELQDDGRRQGQAGGRRLARQPEGLGRQVAARRGRLQEHGVAGRNRGQHGRQRLKPQALRGGARRLARRLPHVCTTISSLALMMRKLSVAHSTASSPE